MAGLDPAIRVLNEKVKDADARPKACAGAGHGGPEGWAYATTEAIENG